MYFKTVISALIVANLLALSHGVDQPQQGLDQTRSTQRLYYEWAAEFERLYVEKSETNLHDVINSVNKMAAIERHVGLDKFDLKQQSLVVFWKIEKEFVASSLDLTGLYPVTITENLSQVFDLNGLECSLEMLNKLSGITNFFKKFPRLHEAIKINYDLYLFDCTQRIEEIFNKILVLVGRESRHLLSKIAIQPDGTRLTQTLFDAATQTNNVDNVGKITRRAIAYAIWNDRFSNRSTMDIFGASLLSLADRLVWKPCKTIVSLGSDLGKMYSILMVGTSPKPSINLDIFQICYSIEQNPNWIEEFNKSQISEIKDFAHTNQPTLGKGKQIVQEPNPISQHGRQVGHARHRGAPTQMAPTQMAPTQQEKSRSPTPGLQLMPPSSMFQSERHPIVIDDDDDSTRHADIGLSLGSSSHDLELALGARPSGSKKRKTDTGVNPQLSLAIGLSAPEVTTPESGGLQMALGLPQTRRPANEDDDDDDREAEDDDEATVDEMNSDDDDDDDEDDDHDDDDDDDEDYQNPEDQGDDDDQDQDQDHD